MILIYDQKGKILQTIEVSNPIIESEYDPSPNFKVSVNRRYRNDEYWVVNGVVTPLPSKPNPYAEFDFDQQTWVNDSTSTAAAIRFERDKKLAESDWTQGRDVPQTVSDLWAEYRQKLRDLPQQAGFPTNVEWPTTPR